MTDAVRLMPLAELRGKGFEVLVRELGPANALRFLHLYHAGSGNYTEEKERWLDGMTLSEIQEEIDRMRLRGEL